MWGKVLSNVKSDFKRKRIFCHMSLVCSGCKTVTEKESKSFTSGKTEQSQELTGFFDCLSVIEHL